MRAIRFEGAGQADVIKLLEEPLPQLRPHDLLVRVHAAGLNRADILQRQGYYGDRPDFGDSLIPGLENAGSRLLPPVSLLLSLTARTRWRKQRKLTAIWKLRATSARLFSRWTD